MRGTDRKGDGGDAEEATLQRELDRHREELAAQNEDLRRAHARYALLYERAPVAYVTLDGARRIVELNAAASALLCGSSPDAGDPVRGRPLDELVAPSSRASFRAFHERLVVDGVRQVHETMLETDGRRFLARLEAVRVEAELDGGSACLLCISDETERRRVAEERRQLEAKVAEAFRVETLGLLAGGVANDFRNVLGLALDQLALASIHAKSNERLHPGGKIVVRTRSAPSPGAELGSASAVLIEVEDDGRGMDEATRGRVFDPFFTTKGPGRGVGLSVVHGNVRAHGGTVRVESAPNQGTIFRVYLPVAGLTPETLGRESEKPLTAPWHGSGLVLVVDDNAIVRKAMGEHVARLGFDTCFAGDGIEAIAVAEERRGRLVAVLLDVSMPRMGGEQALVELKRIDAKVPVILMSGLSRAQISLAATTLADGFLEKPFTVTELGRIMQGALARYA